MGKFSVLPALLCICVSGCGGDIGAPPAVVYPVHGVITHNGQPVVGADVTFINADAGRSAFGKTNDKGEYKLTTFGANDGAVEGKSTVTVAKFVSSAPEVPEPDIESEEYMPPGFGGEEEEVEDTKSDIPAQYSSQETSPLIAVVTADAENKLDFDLE